MSQIKHNSVDIGSKMHFLLAKNYTGCFLPKRFDLKCYTECCLHEKKSTQVTAQNFEIKTCFLCALFAARAISRRNSNAGVLRTVLVGIYARTARNPFGHP